MLYNSTTLLLLSLLISQTLSLPSPQSHKKSDVEARKETDRPLARLKNGTYYGIHNRHYNQDFFLGVPFAQPPVGRLRLRQAESLETIWKDERNATEYGYACVGYGEDTYIGANNYVDEDCLTLNVVRPAGYDGVKLPVGVWIYGGGWFEGSSRDPRYNLTYLVNQSVQIEKPIIGVSINYRLHGWGFLYSKEIVEEGLANIGLYDQRMALRWLQENIAAFGGDPGKVTIWGESAGAASVGVHLLGYNGRDDGLFSGAISESGPINGVGLVNPTAEHTTYATTRIFTLSNCTTGTIHQKLNCLRSLPFHSYNSVLEKLGTEGYYNLAFGPLLDNALISQPANQQLSQGKFIRVPYIMGDNSDEGTDFVPEGLNTNEDFRKYLAGFHFDNETLDELERYYPEGNLEEYIPHSHPEGFGGVVGKQFKRVATFATDVIFKAPRRLASEAWIYHTTSESFSTLSSLSNRHKNQHQEKSENDIENKIELETETGKRKYAPLYTYLFTTLPFSIPKKYSTTHFQEVSFVFHNIHGKGYWPDYNRDNVSTEKIPKPPYYGKSPFGRKMGGGVSKGEKEKEEREKRERYVELSMWMCRYWVCFVHGGDPNCLEGEGMVKWPVYNPLPSSSSSSSSSSSNSPSSTDVDIDIDVEGEEEKSRRIIKFHAPHILLPSSSSSSSSSSKHKNPKLELEKSERKQKIISIKKDTYRTEQINFLIEKYREGGGVFGSHEDF